MSNIPPLSPHAAPPPVIVKVVAKKLEGDGASGMATADHVASTFSYVNSFHVAATHVHVADQLVQTLAAVTHLPHGNHLARDLGEG